MNRLSRRFFSVTQLNKYIKGLLETDVILSHIWIKGEISNLKKNLSGHTFFSLKDRQSSVNCVLFKTAGEIIGFELKNGTEVFLYGYVSAYERSGTYQFYVEGAELSGAGSLEARFEALKKKLGDEGLFDEDFKRPIPPYAENIAVITSPYGAAVRDIIKTVRGKNRKINLKIIPVTVQGDKAAAEIERALDFVNENIKADVIILGRGGGSLEDLQAFNEENVARAIFRSEIPVISGVGHQTDFTISDFVSDFRGATPTAAAEAAAWDFQKTLYDTEYYREKAEALILKNIENKRENISRLTEKQVFRKPEKLIELNKIDFKYYLERLQESGKDIIVENSKKLELLDARLNALSPVQVMKRGYSMVYGSNGNVVDSIKSLENGEKIQICFSDGTASARIEGLKES